MARPATLDHLTKKKKRQRKTEQIVLDPELAEQINEAERHVNDTRYQLQAAEGVGNDARIAELVDKLEEAKDKLAGFEKQAEDDEVVVELIFESPGRHVWEGLIDAHRPSKEQKREAREEGRAAPGYNPETFHIAAIAVSLLEPKLTEAEVRELWDSPDWNQAECGALFLAAQTVNMTRQVVEVGNASGMTRSSEPASPTPLPEESPTPSS